MDPGEPQPQGGQRVGGVASTQLALDRGGQDAAAIGDSGGGSEALGQTRHAGGAFQRIAWRYQQPHLVQLQASQCQFGDVAVPGMGGVERATEQANAQSLPMAEAGNRVDHGAVDQGRTCPVPVTT